ncbi:hypothetical protein GNZ12_33335 [Paraburkholderia sp. 1N]|uniref:Glycosyltransferase RgtA/B/C/D-like domain-containing protein n=1 Tax=Paraburkholderia solitsugae TaxID=2675748 RepID=A0ABX2C1V5_9BURK|nr:hypothetical protein [Paraburkholderia solitsugae]NPT46120.1 hypothetical protein [Paraburkholderia solitsugae]
MSIGAHQREESIARSGETPLWRVLYFACVMALSIAYFHSAIEVSNYKHLWMDEVLAVTAAGQPTLVGVNAAIWAGTDFSPPLLHYLLHGLMYYADVFSAPLIYRVPSILSVYLAAWLIYLLVRRYLSAAMALVAFALILGSGLFEFAVQARQYGLLTLDLSAALFIWDGFRRTRYPSASALALWAVFAMGLGTHFYGFLSIAAIGMCEVLYFLTGGSIRWRIWLALVLTIPVEAGLHPLAAHLASFNAGDNKALSYYAHPTVGAFSEALWKVLLGGSGGTLVIAIAALSAILISVAKVSPLLADKLNALEGGVTPTSAADRLQFEILLGALLLLPFVIFAFSLLITHSFSYRYVVACTLFFGMAGAYLLDKLTCKRAVALITMPVLILILISRGHAQDDVASVIASLRQVPAGLPIVVENGRDYIELMGANDNPSKDRLYFLKNSAGYVSPDPTNEHAATRMVSLGKGYKVVAAREFLAHQKDFYLFTTPEHGTREGFLPWLFADSIATRLLFSGPDATVLQVHQGDK